MWIFTLDGFFSAVMNQNNSNEIMVRSRRKEDLENMLERIGRSDLEILEWTGTDYAFRVFMARKVWTRYLTKMSQELDYTNFKAAAIGTGDHGRSAAYHDVWSRLSRWQNSGIGGGGPELFEEIEEEYHEDHIWPEYDDDPDGWLRNYWIR